MKSLDVTTYLETASRKMGASNMPQLSHISPMFDFYFCQVNSSCTCFTFYCHLLIFKISPIKSCLSIVQSVSFVHGKLGNDSFLTQLTNTF